MSNQPRVAPISRSANAAVASRAHPDSRVLVPAPLQGYAYRRHLQSLAFSFLARRPLPITQRDTQAGLKGLRIGGAEISKQHANFIVNRGGASATDVYSLMHRAQDEVARQFRVWLRPEIQLVGGWSAGELKALDPPGDGLEAPD